MGHLVLIELNMNRIIVSQMVIECQSDLWHVRLDHLPQITSRRLIGELVHLVELRLRHIHRTEREFHIDELLRVQVSMPVLCGGPRRGERSARSVDGLPLVAQIDTSSHFTDQGRSETLITEFLVHTEEVNLSHLDRTAIDDHGDWDGSDEAAKFALATNTDDPVRIVAGRVQSPPQEVDRVIETELALRVLHVMVGQQVVHLHRFLVIAEVDLAPNIRLG